MVGEPLERIAVDLLGPLPLTYDKNKYILVVTDYFTRFAEAYALPDIEATTVADKLLVEFICKYGVPVQIHTDQGSQFTSELFKELCSKLNISKTRNSPFHPQSSGLVEKLNGTIESMLSKFVSKNQRDWDKFLPYLMLAYRSSIHDTLGESPNFMMFGREVFVPIDLIFGKPWRQEPKPVHEYVDNLTNRMEKVHEVVRDRLTKAADRQKRRYDLCCTSVKFKVGEGVLLHNNGKYKGRSQKLQNKWDVPYTITKCISDILYRIQEGPKTKAKVVHINRLKPYTGNMRRWYQPSGGPALNTRGTQNKD